jgi:hypothetical protein
MLTIIVLIVLMLFLSKEMTPRSPVINHNIHMCRNEKNIHKKEKFSQGYINPYQLEEYNSSGYDSEYYYDRSGLKGTLFNMLPSPQTPNRIIKPSIKKEDHFNCVVNKLGLYTEDIYNKCNPMTM